MDEPIIGFLIFQWMYYCIFGDILSLRAVITGNMLFVSVSGFFCVSLIEHALIDDAVSVERY